MDPDVQKRLFHFEAQPPEEVWHGVNNALEEELPSLSRRLSLYVEHPPATIWSSITYQLDKPATRVIPLYRKPVFKMATAVVAVLVIGAIVLFTGKDQTDTQLSQGPAKGVKFPDQPQKQNDVLPEEKSIANKEIEKVKENPPAERNVSIQKTPGRYLTVSNEDGSTVRLSKKVVPVFNCAEDVASLNRIRCQEDIQSLQQKMASSASPSTDFAGLMEMIKRLEEKN